MPGHSRRSCSSPKAEVAAVNESNQASWQISTDQPRHLLVGLFIRDVAGVPSRKKLAAVCFADRAVRRCLRGHAGTRRPAGPLNPEVIVWVAGGR